MSNDEIARDLLDTTSYLVIATADAEGVPWASPVWFAHENYHELFWVSAPDARHSQNIAARPSIGMVVFDSTVAPGAGQAVYMTARAYELEDSAAIDHGLDVFSGASTRRVGTRWGRDQITGDARLRLYCATGIKHWILDPGSPFDIRVSVNP